MSLNINEIFRGTVRETRKFNRAIVAYWDNHTTGISMTLLIFLFFIAFSGTGFLFPLIRATMESAGHALTVPSLMNTMVKDCTSFGHGTKCTSIPPGFRPGVIPCRFLHRKACQSMLNLFTGFMQSEIPFLLFIKVWGSIMQKHLWLPK